MSNEYIYPGVLDDLFPGMSGTGKIIRDAWGSRLKVTPDLTAGVIYPSNADPNDVLKSLELLALEFKHRIEKSEKKN